MLTTIFTAQERRHEILERLLRDKLQDLSVSRTTFSWGVPLPNGNELVLVLYIHIYICNRVLTCPCVCCRSEARYVRVVRCAVQLPLCGGLPAR
jgi:hypothetical protein